MASKMKYPLIGAACGFAAWLWLALVGVVCYWIDPWLIHNVQFGVAVMGAMMPFAVVMGGLMGGAAEHGP